MIPRLTIVALAAAGAQVGQATTPAPTQAPTSAEPTVASTAAPTTTALTAAPTTAALTAAPTSAASTAAPTTAALTAAPTTEALTAAPTTAALTAAPTTAALTAAPTAAAPTYEYYQLANGTCCCPAGELITTKADCEVAFDALSFNRTVEWVGSSKDIAAGCSLDIGGGSPFHFNENTSSTSSRSDSAPICQRVSTATATPAPSAAPTTMVGSTEAPTTMGETEAPTTMKGTAAPTEAPTTGPTTGATEAPTLNGTAAPTEAPTTGPTLNGTEVPTAVPAAPTPAPTAAPTAAPTPAPPVQAAVSMTLAGVDFATLDASSAAKTALITTVENTLVTTGVNREYIKNTTLSAGSVVAETTIEAPQAGMENAATLLNQKKEDFQTSLLGALTNNTNFTAVVSGNLSVAVQEVVVPTRAPTPAPISSPTPAPLPGQTPAPTPSTTQAPTPPTPEPPANADTAAHVGGFSAMVMTFCGLLATL